ncbi:MAG TPA: TlpA disulfide reductase family protein [Saprospiraceae bacterium]|nr:TlpA disulfide reductase family protein [Saprospiraceae bacterium]HMP26132.1 TlpA disulfide reductase family protein [Saprospiraceae bacterium]
MAQLSKFLLLFSVLLFWQGCASAQQEEKSSALPPPAKMLGAIPVYDEFEHLEPLFHWKNDTTYVINFWATWCKPCVEELPYFEQLHKNLEGEKVKVVLISLDFPRQLETKLLPFVEKNQLRSEVIALVDIQFNNWIDRVSPEWNGAIPVTMVYNAQKRHFYGEQFPSYEYLEKLVKAFL